MLPLDLSRNTAFIAARSKIFKRYETDFSDATVRKIKSKKNLEKPVKFFFRNLGITMECFTTYFEDCQLQLRSAKRVFQVPKKR